MSWYRCRRTQWGTNVSIVYMLSNLSPNIEQCEQKVWCSTERRGDGETEKGWWSTDINIYLGRKLLTIPAINLQKDAQIFQLSRFFGKMTTILRIFKGILTWITFYLLDRSRLGTTTLFSGTTTCRSKPERRIQVCGCAVFLQVCHGKAWKLNFFY